MEAAPAPVPGRSLQAARRPRPSLGAARDRGWKGESGKKERKEKERGRVNLGESAEGRAASECPERGGGGGEGDGEEEEEEEGSAPPPSPPTCRGACGAWDHVPALAPGRHPAPPVAARAPQVSVCLRRVGVRLALPSAPSCRRAPQREREAGAGRVYLPAAKTFIMGCTSEGLGGNLRCRQFSEVHAQMGNLPDLYTGACVVRQKQLYLAGIPSPGSCLRCIIGNYEWKKVRVGGGDE
nr:uncharacterized protein LOC129468112 [Symphalangus syndactylus]